MNIDKSLKWITQRINVLILIALFLVEYQQYKFYDCNVIQVPSVLSHIQRCSMDKALGLNNPVCRCPSISSDPTNPGVDFGPKFCHHHSELLARDSWVPRGLIESQNCSGWKSLFLDPAFPSTDYGIHPRAPALLFKLPNVSSGSGDWKYPQHSRVSTVIRIFFSPSGNEASFQRKCRQLCSGLSFEK